jgi:superfamily II DNA or RNA helicase
MTVDARMRSEGEGPTVLRSALDDCEPIYLLPKDDVAELVISPALAASGSAEVMIGFFASHSLAEIAPGLAAYLCSTDAPFRLIVSPFLTHEDQEALRTDKRAAQQIAEDLFLGQLPDADMLSRHTLACLAWLSSLGRLQLKIALMRDALFHPKIWLFRSGADLAALHGSANMTGAGLGRNREQLSLARSWLGADSARVCARLAGEFDLLWGGGDSECVVIDLSRALEEKIVRDYKSEVMPTEGDFHGLWRKAHGLPEQSLPEASVKSAGPPRFEIPDWLNYRTGDYAHQGQAIDAWRENAWRGIIEMCTGAGKTLTAMVGAWHLQRETGPLLIVVAAPYKVLLSQWCGEISVFGLRPVDLTEEGGPRAREQAIAGARRRLRMGFSPAEALVVSNDLLTTPQFLEQIAKWEGPKLLVADECHNLGASSFTSSPPEQFEYRLGLSATPVRQYDDAGTVALFDYFGPQCFSFGLEQAIGRCLTPYDYHVHFVSLAEDEMDEWRELSDEIGKLAWKIEAGLEDERLEHLLLKRRRVLETARAKIARLDGLLDDGDLRRMRFTLIYGTDKDPKQLEAVNDLLHEKHARFHQLTAEETRDKDRTGRILQLFQAGEIQILTAKRVLDEGVNIPQIERAYILASTTVRRQWVQRRGRLLRMCKEIGKTHADIHDLVALPPGSEEGIELDSEARKIVNAELDRVWEFARLSRNGAAKDGPFAKVEAMRALLRSKD